MYNIEFYENQSGESELWNFLEKLRNEAATNKDSRIQYKQMMFYIELLQNNGTRLGENITKHLDNEIWELRPGTNRVFYFFIEKDTFVLLHHFRKKSQKTPRREIEKAKAERKDYLERREENWLCEIGTITKLMLRKLILRQKRIWKKWKNLR